MFAKERGIMALESHASRTTGASTSRLGELSALRHSMQ